MDCKVPDDVAACTGANAELVDGFFCSCDKCGMVRQTEVVIGRHIDNVASIQIDMTALRAVQCTIHKKTFFLSCLGSIPARFLVYGYHTTKWKKTQMGKRYFSTVLRLFFGFFRIKGYSGFLGGESRCVRVATVTQKNS